MSTLPGPWKLGLATMLLFAVAVPTATASSVVTCDPDGSSTLTCSANGTPLPPASCPDLLVAELNDVCWAAVQLAVLVVAFLP